MTREERAHAQALEDAHFMFGGHEAGSPAWQARREAWIAAREQALATAKTTKTTATGVSR